MEALINNHLRASLQTNDVLHRFRAGRGTGTAIIELKLAQELSGIDQETLFLILLDLMKAYDNVDRDQLLITLEEYGVGPRLYGLLDTFWDCHKVGPIQNVCYGSDLIYKRGTTQGGILSPDTVQRGGG